MSGLDNVGNMTSNNEKITATRKTVDSLCNLYNKATEKPGAQQVSLFGGGLGAATLGIGILKNSGTAVKYGVLGLAASALFYNLCGSENDSSIVEDAGSVTAGVSTASLVASAMSKHSLGVKGSLVGLGASALALILGRADKKDLGDIAGTAGKIGLGASVATLLLSFKNPKHLAGSIAGLAASLGSIYYSENNKVPDIILDGKELPDAENVEVKEKSIEYNIENYFKNSETRAVAQYVDLEENGGNGNSKLDGEEINTFKKVIKHKYSDFEYDFTEWDKEQTKNLLYKKDIYASPFYEKSGSKNLGKEVSNKLDKMTSQESYIKIDKIIDRINKFPVEEKKYDIIKEFLTGYTGGKASDGIFKQIASEYSSVITNDTMLKFMKSIMDVIPEEKKNSNEYLTIEEMYEFYSQKPANEAFDTPNVFNNNQLVAFDNAILKLLDITNKDEQ